MNTTVRNSKRNVIVVQRAALQWHLRLNGFSSTLDWPMANLYYLIFPLCIESVSVSLSCPLESLCV